MAKICSFISLVVFLTLFAFAPNAMAQLTDYQISISATADASEPGTDGSITFDSNLVVAGDRDVYVCFNVSGTATEGVDYNFTGVDAAPGEWCETGELVWIQRGQSSATVGVEVLDDAVAEADPETVVVTIDFVEVFCDIPAIMAIESDGGNPKVEAWCATASIGIPSTATVNIADNDQPTVYEVNFDSSVVYAAEPSTDGTLNFSLDQPSTDAIFICFDVVGGTATNGVDFSLTNDLKYCGGYDGIAVVPGNSDVPSSVAETDLVVINDSLVEWPEETVEIEIKDAWVNCECSDTVEIGPNFKTTVHIEDDDRPTTTVEVFKISDAAEPATNGVFEFRLDRPAPDDISICFGPEGGTATEGEDYEDFTGGWCDQEEVTILKGGTDVQAELAVIDDLEFEGTETAMIEIFDARANCDCEEYLVIGANDRVEMDIEDDDGWATFSVEVSFDDQNPDAPVRIALECSNATIAEATQYAKPSRPAVFDLTLTDPEGNAECRTESVTGPRAYLPEEDWGEVPCGFDWHDVTPTEVQSCDWFMRYQPAEVGIEPGQAAQEPDQNGRFDLVLNHSPPWGGMDVYFSVGGSATEGQDYENLGESLFVPYGETSAGLPLLVIDDDEQELIEKVTVSIEADDVCGECQPAYEPADNSEATLEILDNDWVIVSIEAMENAAEPDTAGRFMLYVDQPAPEGGLNVTMDIGGTATGDEDYQVWKVPVHIPAGSTQQEIVVMPIDDETAEETETISVFVLPGKGYDSALGNGSRASIDLLDDNDDGEEPPVQPDPGISVTSPDLLETDEDGASDSFTVVLIGEPLASVSIAVESSDPGEGTVSPASLEFTTTNWKVPQTVTVTGQPDDELDGDIEYTVILHPAVSEDEGYHGMDPSDAMAINLDTTLPPEDPSAAEFTMQVYEVMEADGVAEIGIRRTGGLSMPFTALFETVDDSGDTTATAGEDYASTSTDVNWAENDAAEKIVQVPLMENIDDFSDPVETVELRLSAEGMDDVMAMLEIESDIEKEVDDALQDLDLDPNQEEVAKVIVQSCPQGNNAPDFQGLCEAIIRAAADEQSIEEALRQTTPDDAAAVRSTGMQTTNVQMTAIDGRLGTLRGGGGAGFSASGFTVNIGDMALNSSLVKSFAAAYDQNSPAFMQVANQNDTDTVIDAFGRWGTWISGRLVMGEKDPTTNQIAYDFDTAGLTMGMDYRFTDEFVAGMAVGYANTDADLAKNDGELDATGYSLSLYGTWFRSDSFYLGGSLGYGKNDYDHVRGVRYTLTSSNSSTGDVFYDVNQTMAASYDGSQYSFAFSGGWDFDKDGWTFGPTFSISYVNVDVDPYDEQLISSNIPNAITGWAVHIDDQSYESLQPAIGFEFTKAISTSWGVFIPQGYIDVVSELEDSGSMISGYYLGDANKVDFSLMTDDFEETFARAGLGFGMILKNNKSAFLMVDADFGRDLLTTYYINAGFRWQF